jgi:CheY-like chemotaxis protein
MAMARVLIVEDERIIAHDLQQRLTRLGHTVATAATGAQAIAQATAQTPDLVLMDIGLQGVLDGVDTAEHLWERFRLRCLYLTAYGDAPTVARAQRTQPLGYLAKPFRAEALETTLNGALKTVHDGVPSPGDMPTA